MNNSSNKHLLFTSLLYRFSNYWPTLDTGKVVIFTTRFAVEIGLCIQTSTNHVKVEKVAEVLKYTSLTVEGFCTAVGIYKKGTKVYTAPNILKAIEFFLINPAEKTAYLRKHISHPKLNTVQPFIVAGACTQLSIKPAATVERAIFTGLAAATAASPFRVKAGNHVITEHKLQIIYLQYKERVEDPLSLEDLMAFLEVPKLPTCNQYDKRNRYGITNPAAKGIQHFLLDLPIIRKEG